MGRGVLAGRADLDELVERVDGFEYKPLAWKNHENNEMPSFNEDEIPAPPMMRRGRQRRPPSSHLALPDYF